MYSVLVGKTLIGIGMNAINFENMGDIHLAVPQTLLKKLLII